MTNIYPGDTLTATPATSTGNPAPSTAYQWLQDGEEISGATSNTLVLTDDHSDHLISVRQSASNFLSTDHAISSTLGPVKQYPAALFKSSEVGVWYDPSDVANLSWRRNLLTYTEQFDISPWTNTIGGTGTNPVIVSNQGLSPDNTTTADRIQFSLAGGTTTSDISRRRQSYNTPTTSHTFSVYIRSFDGTSTYTMHIVGASGNTTNIVVTGSWQRFSVAETGAGGAVSYAIGLRGGQTPANSNTADVLVWGAQLEVGSTATEYQRISNVTNEVFERFPKATLYQDVAGTTPVTTPGQSVALMLDKSQGVLGPELLTNGGFDTDTAWTKGTGWTISGGIASANVTGYAGIAQAIGAVVGRPYRITLTVTVVSGALGVGIGPSGANVFDPLITVSGQYTFLITPAAGTSNGNFYVRGNGTSGAFVGSVDNISVREVLGIHATQATVANRPIYSVVPQTGRRNLLTYTEQFDNAVWSNTLLNVTQNTGTAPNGFTTAALLVPTNVSGGHSVTRSVSASGVCSVSFYVKAAGYNFFAMAINNDASFAAWFNLTTGAATSVGGSVTSTSSVSVGNGWWRVTLTANTSIGFIQIYVGSSASFAAFTGDSTSGILIWGAQLEVATAATAYQRVVSQYDVTESGVTTLHYLWFDGVDDWMQTGTITPGVDKAQVFAGVRKLSDAAAGIITEMSTNLNTNNGSLFIAAPHANGVASYVAGSKGTVPSTPIESGYPAPHTAVLTALMDISAPLATLAVNRVTNFPSTTSQGTGNYLAYPLYIGRRAGTSLPFNGHIYGLITRFGANLSNDQITRAETWIARKTGITL